MSDHSYKLSLSTRAIVGSEKAVHLVEQKERLEAALIKQDVPLCLDMSRAFLETVFKTVLTDRVSKPCLEQGFKQLFRSVRENITFNDNKHANALLGNLASGIVHQVNAFRNDFGAASHGDDGFHDNPIGIMEAEFIASAVDGLASFVYSKHRSTVDIRNAQRLNYLDHQDFNDWLDEQNEGWEMVGTSIYLTASEILFNTDLESYKEALIQYQNLDKEELE